MVLGYLPARQPDNDKFRLWEVAGTAHADVYTFVAGFIDSGDAPDRRARGGVEADGRRRSVIALEHPINTGPQHYVLQAALAHFDRWLRDGTPPPRAPRLEVRDDDPTQFAVDDHGNARGGIRTPHVDVPAAVLSGLGNDGAPSRASAGRPSRSAPSSSHRCMRARPTTAPSSTPPPTPPSPRAGSSKPTPPRSRPSPPSSTPPDSEPASTTVPIRQVSDAGCGFGVSSGRRTRLCRGRP